MKDLVEQGKRAGMQGYWPEAERWFRIAYENLLAQGDRASLAVVTLYLGHAILNQGRNPEACARLGEARDRLLAGGATEDARRVEDMLENAGCREASSKRQTLDEIVLGFIDTMNWDHACDYISIHPELLDPKADDILANLTFDMERLSGSSVPDDLIKSHRQFLKDCRELGLDKMRARYTARRRGLTDEHLKAILLNTPAALTFMPERKSEWREKLSGLIEEAECQDDPDTAFFLKAVIAVLDEGIDAVDSVESSIPQTYQAVWGALINILKKVN